MIHDEIKTLYQYTTVERAACVLETKKIYVPSPVGFNDPFDCAIELDKNIDAGELIKNVFSLYREEGKDWGFIKKQLDQCFSENGEFSPEQKKRNEEAACQFVEENERQGVLCLTEDPLSPLMWAHYGCKHCGVCLGFSRTEGSCLGNDEVTLPVQYSDIYPQVNFGEIGKRDGSTHQKLFFTKARDWAYEKEWRSLVPNGGEYAHIPGEICEVILGCRIADEDLKLIKGLCNEQGISVTKCIKMLGSFEFKKEVV